jgi:hypothetical protein
MSPVKGIHEPEIRLFHKHLYCVTGMIIETDAGEMAELAKAPPVELTLQFCFVIIHFIGEENKAYVRGW